MKEKHSFNFLIGLLIGGLAALLFWYWQKSTTAEDGALALLDRLAATQKKVEQLRTELAHHEGQPIPVARGVGVPPFLAQKEEQESESGTAFDFTAVKGIGPVFNERLHEAGVASMVALKALSAKELGDLLEISEGRAENILQAAA